MKLLRSIAAVLLTPVLLGSAVSTALAAPVVPAVDQHPAPSYRMTMTPRQSLLCTFTSVTITCHPDFPVTWKDATGRQANTVVISLADAHITGIGTDVQWPTAPVAQPRPVNGSTRLEGLDVTVKPGHVSIGDAGGTVALITPDSYDVLELTASVSAT
ncbi:hypothetical protein [Corynebacterium pacaense]|uniref:hypothetical protein n=1 Tax=Corynebacterium pacaense TaxID=1816684 RepID=UPI0009B9432A|nr:hypothetical protein [Corynebacterium pacaense]